MLLGIAPAGSFAAAIDGRVVGTAIGIDYGRFGWIAMMLVDPAYRGRGLGARLLEAAMSAIPPNLPIRLDATPLGRPLYGRYGFQDEVVLSRHVLDAPARERVVEPEDSVSGIHPLTAIHLPSVMENDARVFGGNRLRVLEWAMAGAPQYAFVAPGESAPQYCLGRTGRLFDQIGPVVAQNPDMAKALVRAALGRAGDNPVVIDAFEVHETFAGWLRATGFRVQRPLYRMCRPGDGHMSDRVPVPPSLIEFAILGPEFA